MHNSLSLLNYTRLIKEKDAYLAQSTGYDFNIFSILDRERYEVGTHSYFLYELLSPSGKHNQGVTFLELFLEDMLHIENYGDISKARVVRESLTKEDNRRIDFLIECESIVIGIEMKIDAKDQVEQLQDYYLDLKTRAKNSEKEVKLYYLTLDAKGASLESLGNLSKEKVINLSFEKDIYEWIKRCMEFSINIPILREALHQYLILIEKLVGKKESVVEEISRLLLKDDNLATAIDISKSIEPAKIEIQKQFWKLFLEKLPEEFIFTNFDFAKSGIDEKVSQYFSLKKSYRYYGARVDLVKKEGYTISFYIELHNKITGGFTVSKENEQGEPHRANYCNEEMFQKVRESLGEKNIFDYTSDWWIVLKHFESSNKIDFYDFTKETLELSSDAIKMDRLVDSLVDEVKEIMDSTIPMLKKVLS